MISARYHGENNSEDFLSELNHGWGECLQISSNFAPAIVVNLLKLKTLSLDDLDLSLKVDADKDDYLSFLTISC